MKHVHKASGQTFEVSEAANGAIIIGYWREGEINDNCPPYILIDYYFGGYDYYAIDNLIDKWLANRAKEISVLQAAMRYMDAYLTVNRDVLDYPEVESLEQALTECAQLLDNRSWRFTCKHPKEWQEAEKLKKALEHCMDANGADIQITIKHDDGTAVTADLYDHAALVQSLYDSLDYFQSEL